MPPLGGFNLTMLGIELKRMMRNRRTVFFTLVMPVMLYLIIGTNDAYSGDKAGSGNVSAYILISMAAYGAVLASTSGGAMVATERALGWSRQLRLTPLAPIAYILIKAIVALALGVLSRRSRSTWSAPSPARPRCRSTCGSLAALIAWLGSIVFAAFGLFMGYLAAERERDAGARPDAWPASPRSVGSGSRSPGSTRCWATSPRRRRSTALAQLARWPLYGGAPHLFWIVNLVVWLALFVGGAAWRMSKDTARV